MAGVLISYKGETVSGIKEFMVDTEAEIDELPNRTRGGIGNFANDLDFATPAPMGSRVYYKSDNKVKMKLLFSDGWTILE